MAQKKGYHSCFVCQVFNLHLVRNYVKWNEGDTKSQLLYLSSAILVVGGWCCDSWSAHFSMMNKKQCGCFWLWWWQHSGADLHWQVWVSGSSSLTACVLLAMFLNSTSFVCHALYPDSSFELYPPTSIIFTTNALTAQRPVFMNGWKVCTADVLKAV